MAAASVAALVDGTRRTSKTPARMREKRGRSNEDGGCRGKFSHPFPTVAHGGERELRRIEGSVRERPRYDSLTHQAKVARTRTVADM